MINNLDPITKVINNLGMNRTLDNLDPITKVINNLGMNRTLGGGEGLEVNFNIQLDTLLLTYLHNTH